MVEPRRGDERTARPDDGDAAAQAELLGLVDGALDERRASVSDRSRGFVATSS